MGRAAARGNDDGARFDLHLRELTGDFACCNHVAQRAKRRMPRRQVDYIGRAPLRAQFGGDFLQPGIGPSLVLAMFVGMQGRA